MVPEGSIKLKKVQEGSRRFKQVKKVPMASEGTKKGLEGSERF